MNYVIIGNSAAGIAAAEAIRRADAAGKITVVSDEPYHTYGRPLISYYLLGATDRQRMLYRPADFYEKLGIGTRFGVRAERVDPAKKKVFLRGGKSLSYDKLLVATGSRPFVPPAEGLDGVQNKFTFMTLDDALALEKALTPASRVLIVGAGLIGLKCYEGIAERAGSVAIVDMADRVLSSVLDAEGAAVVQRRLESRGARFYLSDCVEKYEDGVARLRGGGEIGFDILVLAVGVRPNVELVKEAGGAVGRGIVTDAHQKTSLPDVYAAGDCCESTDALTGRQAVLAILPNACAQGECAGKNMAGVPAETADAFPLNAVGFFGLHVLTAGCRDGESYTERDGETYRKLFYADGRLRGFILVGCPERAGIYTSLIREKTKLSDVDFELLKKQPLLRAFSREARAGKLAQEV